MADIMNNMCHSLFSERMPASYILDVLHGKKRLAVGVGGYKGTTKSLAAKRAEAWRTLCRGLGAQAAHTHG